MLLDKARKNKKIPPAVYLDYFNELQKCKTVEEVKEWDANYGIRLENHFKVLQYQAQLDRTVATGTETGDVLSGDEFYRSPEWRALRYQALVKYGAVCACCGRSAKHGLVMHVDHIKPRSKFPELALDINNLQILCEDCNIAKSNTDEIKWRA
ncbi:HNH endonuclease [Salmonella enterica subsp. enterica serovar Saintpaul]|nr:HNH endonuclease [Salmonella enterica subsp. enterica serovar Saintpaul]